MDEFHQFHGAFEEDIYTRIAVESVVNARNCVGGTSEETVLMRIRDIEGGKKW
jgi:argininosuccinate lyase